MCGETHNQAFKITCKISTKLKIGTMAFASAARVINPSWKSSRNRAGFCIEGKKVVISVSSSFWSASSCVKHSAKTLTIRSLMASRNGESEIRTNSSIVFNPSVEFAPLLPSTKFSGTPLVRVKNSQNARLIFVLNVSNVSKRMGNLSPHLGPCTPDF